MRTFLNILAYIDPGSGSFLMQMLIAGLLGFVYAIKLYWFKIKEFFFKIFGSHKEKDNK